MDSEHDKKIDLNDLRKGMSELTPALGAFFSEAGAVCLDEQGHKNGVDFSIQGNFTDIFKLYWQEVTDQMRQFWNDDEVATENAAYGLACLLIRELTPFKFIQKSKKGPGFDFWLGRKDDFLFQKKARLEVSGIRSGEQSDIKVRLRRKKKQIKPSSLPVYIIVVEFGTPQSKVEEYGPDI